MLMIAFSPMNQSIADDTARNDFVNSFGSTMESFELISESEINIADTTAYRHEMKLKMSGENWTSSMVTFDCTGGVISFLMTTLEESDKNYNSEFDSILESIKNTNIPSSSGNSDNEDPEAIQQKLDIKAIPTLDGLVCVFITNNSETIIDELNIQLNYKDDSGTTIDMDKDGHDMVLPGSTVVSRMDAPKAYSDFETITTVELDAHPGYENHSNDVVVNSNQGEQGIIVEITNNSGVSLDEVEFIAVLYKENQISTVKYPKDIYDVPTGQTITEKVDIYTDEYDRFEIYLNQAHTFGF